MLLSIAGVLAVLLAAAVIWFEPYKLWIDNTVDEPAPEAGAVLLASGSFVSHEHATSGDVQLFKLTEGRQILRLSHIDTSNGPVLKVWLSDAPVLTGKPGWTVFATHQHIDLGRLRGNKGSQNYLIPADVDASHFTSVTIWCARFHVSFGAAPVNRTG